MSVKLLFFAGSARKESFNKKLAKAAAAIAKAKGAEAIFIDLADYEMPLFCQDVEANEGQPEKSLALKKLLVESDGFYIASPEYNGLPSPLLKNTIDWTSRSAGKDDPPLACYKGKAAAIGSCSPGPMGGIRGLPHLRTLLSNIGVHVMPKQVCVGGTDSFNEDGSLKNEGLQAMLEASVEELIKIASL